MEKEKAKKVKTPAEELLHLLKYLDDEKISYLHECAKRKGYFESINNPK